MAKYVLRVCVVGFHIPASFVGDHPVFTIDPQFGDAALINSELATFFVVFHPVAVNLLALL